MRRQRLGILLNGGHRGGPGRYVRSLLGGIDRDEFEVIVFGATQELCAGRGAMHRVPIGEEPSFPSSCESAAEGARMNGRALARRLAPSPVKYWMGFQREAQRLAQMLRRCRVDLLHTNETGCEESALAARMAGVPSVIGTFHVLPDVDLSRLRSQWVHRHLERRSVQALDLGIAVSEAGRQAWTRRTGVPPHRIVTIHNGIEPAEFCRRRPAPAARAVLGIPEDGSVVIGTAARLEPVKGLDHLLEAAACLRGRGMNVRVVIAGDGSLQAELRRRMKKLGIAESTHLVGFQPDVRTVLEALDIFVLPSLSEALPYGLMEAMAMELPVVASDVGGVPEMVIPGQTGLLVPPAEGARLAEALRPLVESAELRGRMGVAGRRVVIERFDERQMVRRTIEMYRTMLRERRACA